MNNNRYKIQEIISSQTELSLETIQQEDDNIVQLTKNQLLWELYQKKIRFETKQGWSIIGCFYNLVIITICITLSCQLDQGEGLKMFDVLNIISELFIIFNSLIGIIAFSKQYILLFILFKIFCIVSNLNCVIILYLQLITVKQTNQVIGQMTCLIQVLILQTIILFMGKEVFKNCVELKILNSKIQNQ